MKIKLVIGAAAVVIVIAASAVMALRLSGKNGGGNVSVPELIFPDNGASASGEDMQPHISDISGGADTSASSADESSSYSTTAAEYSEQETDSTSGSAAAHSEASSASSAADSTTQSGTLQTTSSASSAASISSAYTTDSRSTDITTTSAPVSTCEEPADEDSTPQNILLTSGDPQHYIRFEFLPQSVSFSGVYSGDPISAVYVFNPEVHSYDLQCSGDFFSGTLDLSGFAPGYYIIVVRTESAAGMYYVFEMTGTTSRPVPADELPAQRNLEASFSPIELEKDGVLLHITPDGDTQRAAHLLQQVKEISDTVCAGLTDDYSKARALAEWVSQNIYYDHDAKDGGDLDEVITLDYVLTYHRSVCFGWTNLYSALCQAQGIDCYNASGSVVTGSRCFLQTDPSDERSHSWNMVIIDGRRIWVDTVWDSSNDYEFGNYFIAPYDFQYFDIDNALLSHDHRVTRFEHRDYFALS